MTTHTVFKVSGDKTWEACISLIEHRLQLSKTDGPILIGVPEELMGLTHSKLFVPGNCLFLQFDAHTGKVMYGKEDVRGRDVDLAFVITKKGFVPEEGHETLSLARICLATRKGRLFELQVDFGDGDEPENSGE
jgi:hypothetical protein